MALTQPLAGLSALVLILAVAAASFLVATRRDRGGAPVAGTGALRALPRFHQLARRRSRQLTVRALGLLLAAAGAALLVAQPVAASTASDERASRDIVLCLDVSGSMTEIDRGVIDAYLRLAADLDGERIALVLFDASAITVFPLTDDAAFITEQLTATRDRLDGRVLPGTQIGDGTSLVGDGLASCLQRFDVPEQNRSRTLVLATDNQVAGAPLFTLEQAVGLAVEQGVLVYGIVPADNTPKVTQALTQQLRSTGGDTLPLAADTDVTAITEAVEKQERTALAGPPRARGEALLWPGAVTMLVGATLAGAAWLAGRRRR
ncbi:vWA domain-containing protein [Tessaracoccus palaemonis]|uniref:VWA domain-containing protein n=1 Tax=Tessaracoccus palaemonis TaxID=2829499 RepID=A0ABX8SN64_9ACTN|nr:VWA domain-containing protein [Tessaracoccus palaemonis]QXT63603.1 VWA domain-containing protein [Tessaracoccus palaemonis]